MSAKSQVSSSASIHSFSTLPPPGAQLPPRASFESYPLTQLQVTALVSNALPSSSTDLGDGGSRTGESATSPQFEIPSNIRSSNSSLRIQPSTPSLNAWKYLYSLT